MAAAERGARAWAEALGAVTVLDLEDRVHALGTLWNDGPVLLVYLRHYG